MACFTQLRHAGRGVARWRGARAAAAAAALPLAPSAATLLPPLSAAAQASGTAISPLSICAGHERHAAGADGDTQRGQPSMMQLRTLS
jgi:hypothetical protein